MKHRRGSLRGDNKYLKFRKARKQMTLARVRGNVNREKDHLREMMLLVHQEWGAVQDGKRTIETRDQYRE